MDKKILTGTTNQKLAGYLMFNGFPLISFRPLKENPKINIFFFYKNDSVSNAIDKFYSSTIVK